MLSINRFFYNVYNQVRNLYLNSNLYDKKISKVSDVELIYKPSPHLLSSLIKYQKKKFKIEDFALDKIWSDQNLNNKDYKNLNNFYWFFSLDLKSSKETIQSVVSNWINKNNKFDKRSWNFDLTAKRIIAWLSCHNLTYEEGRSNKFYNMELMENNSVNIHYGRKYTRGRIMNKAFKTREEALDFMEQQVETKFNSGYNIIESYVKDTYRKQKKTKKNSSSTNIFRV